MFTLFLNTSLFLSNVSLVCSMIGMKLLISNFNSYEWLNIVCVIKAFLLGLIVLNTDRQEYMQDITMLKGNTL